MAEPVRTLRLLLESRERRSRELRIARVAGRNTDGTLLLKSLDGPCIARGCRTGEPEGELVKRPVGPCWDNPGAVGVAGLSSRFGAGVLWVESIDPDVYEPGESYVVEVVGRGFTERTIFEFLLASSEEVNPFIEITGTELLDQFTCELSIDVSPDAPALVGGDLAFDDGGLQ